MIKLIETADEYLLELPAKEKERAKKIQGRIWDGTRVCWVYPKTEEYLKQLIAEFGADLINNKVIQPVTVNTGTPQFEPNLRPSQAAKEQKFNQAIIIEEHHAPVSKSSGKQDFEKSQEKLKLLTLKLDEVKTQLLEKKEIIKELNDRYISLNREVKELKATNRSLTRQRDNLQISENIYKKEFDTLDRTIKQLTEETARKKSFIKQKAINAASSDEEFELLVNKLPIDKMMPVELMNKIINKLRKGLNISNNIPATDYELISYAEKQNQLSSEAIDLAHLVRKQRNLFAHGQRTDSQDEARILMCLYATALLWPDVKKFEGENNTDSQFKYNYLG